MSAPKSKNRGSSRQPIQRLLVASDLTSYSDRALDRALMLASRFKASLRIVHVLDPTLLPVSELTREKRHMKTLLEREWRESPVASHATPATTAASGDADKVIAQMASASRVDLIVVGHSNRPSLTTAFTGATAERVMAHTSCPVLTVKRRPNRDYASIVVALDTGASSLRALDMALAAFPNAQMTVVHVMEKGSRSPTFDVEDIVRTRCAQARGMGLKVSATPKVVIRTGRPADALQKEIARLNPDLVVAGTHGRTGISKILFGSVAQWLLAIVPSDVLVVRGKS